MFTEYEIETMIDKEPIAASVSELKKDFLKKEAPYLEISDQDFLSLVMMTPTVGIALANGSISLFEELKLNKKARKLSKGGYFLKKDPVVYGLKFLIKKYDEWEDRFLEVIRTCIETLFDRHALSESGNTEEEDYAAYKKTVLNTPYILIRFMSSFFLQDEEDIICQRTINKTDYGRLVEIGKKLELDSLKVFRMFLKTYQVK